ncbi:unnamed protein product [Caenorhabditis auriculariae]|uniref:Uncharacterized protein n=1 Tax=Caenorhabditis auriculariae TaxID=2777116 RepID=A0A8S1GWT5_9PELO|nr:unnamed protein product [Caenorhabditis auriculariae]
MDRQSIQRKTYVGRGGNTKMSSGRMRRLSCLPSRRLICFAGGEARKTPEMRLADVEAALSSRNSTTSHTRTRKLLSETWRDNVDSQEFRMQATSGNLFI